MNTCWCGNSKLLFFSAEYAVCDACGALISLKGMAVEQLQVRDDEIDFYGKKYWLSHQSGDLGFPDIHVRSRNDLTERNLHWLKTLLTYRLPPAKVLELGCSHGSFVALLRQAGYDAAGVEMSPWVVEFGQKTFGAQISVGPIENLEIAPGSLDVIALMDVLEHLPDPVATMAHCLKLLKPDGLLLIQTPQFKEEMNYTALVETKSAFLEQLKADEHLYLFSDRSVTRLFQQLGAEYIQFEPAIFAHYDMFFAVSRIPIQTNTSEQIESALLSSPNRRLTLALLDLRERELNLTLKLKESEADRSARLKQINTLTQRLQELVAQGVLIGRLRNLLNSISNRITRTDQNEAVMRALKESEDDRVARWEQIMELTATLKESEADRLARSEQINTLTAMLKESEADRLARSEQIETLTRMLKEQETGRAAQSEQLAEPSGMPND